MKQKLTPNFKPRIFHKETIQTKIKKNNYLDNYQFVESRVIKNPKKKEKIFTNHIGRGETFTSQNQINQKGEENQSKIKVAHQKENYPKHSIVTLELTNLIK